MAKIEEEEAGLFINTITNDRSQFCQQLIPVCGPHASEHGDELTLNFSLSIVDLHN